MFHPIVSEFIFGTAEYTISEITLIVKTHDNRYSSDRPLFQAALSTEIQARLKLLKNYLKNDN